MNTDKGIWRPRLASYGKLLMRWGWFVVVSIILVTFCTSRLPDTPSVESYQATLQVQVVSTRGIGTTVTFFSQLFSSPDTLNLALSKLNKLQQFRDFQLSDLQAFVTATPVVSTDLVLLNALGDTPQNATVVVNTVYQAFQEEIHTKHSTVVSKLDRLLRAELNQVENDIANSSAQLQYLQATNQQSSSQYRQLNVLYHEQQQRAVTISALLTQPVLGSFDILSLAKNAPDITTIPANPPIMGRRLALSPLIGFIMGVGGVLLASRFSNSIPPRGKKREKVLPHVTSAIPVLPNVRGNRLQVLERASSHGLLLLRRLRHHASEHEETLQVIAVTSPKGHEGKSTIATLFAIAAAQSGLRTLLVDMNPRRPVLHTWFPCSNNVGTLDSIRSLAAGSAGPSPIINTSVTKLGLIPIGNTGQKRASDILEDALRVDGLLAFTQALRKQADLIILDSPPLLSDAGSVNPVTLADAVLLVVDAKRSQSSRVLETEALLANVGASFFLLLNRTRSEAVE